MDPQSVFHLISDITAKEAVTCVLIGGFAVNHYRVSRQTADVDFLITKDDFNKIFSSLVKAGYKKDLEQENFAQLKGTTTSLLDADFMFVDEDTLKKVVTESQEIVIAKQRFLVPSLEHLIALKLHSIKYNARQRLIKDLPDIVSLIRMNHLDYTNEKFKDLCLKFGTEDIYRKILEALQ